MTESSPSDSSNISSSKSSSPSDASFFSDFCCPFTFSCLVFCLIKPPCKLSSSRTELMKVETWPLQIDCKQLILSIFFNKFIHPCCKCCFCTNILIFEICCHIYPNIAKQCVCKIFILIFSFVDQKINCLGMLAGLPSITFTSYTLCSLSDKVSLFLTFSAAVAAIIPQALPPTVPPLLPIAIRIRAIIHRHLEHIHLVRTHLLRTHLLR